MGIFKKIKDFYLEHHTVINCIGLGVIGGVGVGLAIGYSKGHDDGVKYGAYVSGLHDGYGDSNNLLAENGVDVDVSVDVDTPETKDDYSWNHWDESYRENWDKVNEFAKSLNLADGEEFFITGPHTYENEETVVSHLVNNEGAYPPEKLEDTRDWNHWDESYRENWDKVNEFAKSLNLADGEEFFITGPHTYENEETVVSHLFNN